MNAEPREGDQIEVDLRDYSFALDLEGRFKLVELGGVVHLPLFRDPGSMGLFYYEVLGPGVICEEPITDRDHFMQQIPPEVQIVLDPRRHPKTNKWMFYKVPRD